MIWNRRNSNIDGLSSERAVVKCAIFFVHSPIESSLVVSNSLAGSKSIGWLVRGETDWVDWQKLFVSFFFFHKILRRALLSVTSSFIIKHYVKLFIYGLIFNYYYMVVDGLDKGMDTMATICQLLIVLMLISYLKKNRSLMVIH